MFGRIFVASVIALAGCGPDAAEREVCGFRCGPGGECPDGFACYADGRCHRDGSPLDRGCTLDGGPDIAPSILTSVPNDRASDVPTNITLALSFSEPVSGIDDVSFTLRQRGVFEPLPAVVDYADGEQTARLRPMNVLAESTTYVATIEPTVIDATGYPITGFSWEFSTTRDTTPPKIWVVAPPSGAVDVGVDIKVVVESSEPITGTAPSSLLLAGPSGPVSWSIGYAGTTGHRMIPTTALAAHTTYTVTATSAISDFAGNPLAGAPIVLTTFTTGADTVPPAIMQRTPFFDGQTVSPNTTVDVLFSEPMTGLSRTAFTLEAHGVQVPATVSYWNGTSGVRLDPSAPLDFDTTYEVRLWPALTDLAGNPVTPGVLSWPLTTFESAGMP